MYDSGREQSVSDNMTLLQEYHESYLQLVETIYQLFPVFLRNLKFFFQRIERRIHYTMVVLNHDKIMHIDNVRLMYLGKSLIVSTKLFGSRISFQRKECSVGKGHFPYLTSRLITEITDFGSMQEPQISRRSSHNKRFSRIR